MKYYRLKNILTDLEVENQLKKYENKNLPVSKKISEYLKENSFEYISGEEKNGMLYFTDIRFVKEGLFKIESRFFTELEFNPENRNSIINFSFVLIIFIISLLTSKNPIIVFFVTYFSFLIGSIIGDKLYIKSSISRDFYKSFLEKEIHKNNLNKDYA